MKNLPEKIFNTLGLCVKRAEHGLEDLRSSGLNPVEALYLSSSDCFVLNVPIGKILYRRAIYHKMQAIKGGDAAKCRKALVEYYNNFQPLDVAEVLGVENTRPWHSGNPLGAVYPWSSLGPEQMVMHKNNMMKREAKENDVDPDGAGRGYWKGFGPATQGLIDLECKRLVSLHESLGRSGYQDSLGHIGAQIFMRNGDYMIRPKGGWHRTAVMVALGYPDVPMRFRKKDIVISREHAEHWPNVRSGLYSLPEALSFFDSFFVPLLHDASPRSCSPA